MLQPMEYRRVLNLVNENSIYTEEQVNKARTMEYHIVIVIVTLSLSKKIVT